MPGSGIGRRRIHALTFLGSRLNSTSSSSSEITGKAFANPISAYSGRSYLSLSLCIRVPLALLVRVGLLTALPS